MAGALSLGLCLSAPFVLPQVELYFLSARKIHPAGDSLGFLGGVASVATVFPWGLGTFRTLDLSKFFGQGLLGFWIYIGSAAFIIAMIGATVGAQTGTVDSDIKRTALALVVIYFIICSTPLVRLFYTRTAWLAVLGLVILFARGWMFLSGRTRPLKRWAGITLLTGSLAVLVCNVGAGVIYPKVQSRVETRFIEAQRTNPALDFAEPLRRFQVRNFANEVTFKNPETLLAFLGLMALGLFLLKPSIPCAPALNAILILSILPLLSFGHRYIPMHPFTLWDRIRAGGPEQQRVAAKLQPQGLRLLESAPGHHDSVFPGAMSQLFHVHGLQGYSSLMLSNASFLKDPSGHVPANLYDYEYRSETRGLERGEFRSAGHSEPSRFRWAAPLSRSVTLKDETLNTLTLAIEAGQAADLIRRDTFYPGWRAFAGDTELKIHFQPPCFSRVHLPDRATELRFVYQPRHWRLGLWIAVAGGLCLCMWLTVTYQRRKIP
jgi:hypothetical protein